MMACATWLRRDFLIRHGYTPTEPPCNHPKIECPPIGEPEMSLIKLSGENPDMNVTDAIVRDFLVSSQRHLNAATDPETPEADFRTNCMVAQLSGLVAFLLAELKNLDQGTAADLAWEVHDFCEDGEPLAEWVAGELNSRGVDVDAMIREQLARASAVSAVEAPEARS